MESQWVTRECGYMEAISMMGLMMEFEPPFVPTMQKKIRLNRLKS
jgi:hypothetical protein